MDFPCCRRYFRLATLLAVLAALPLPATAQKADDFKAINAEVLALYDKGHHHDGEAKARRALEMAIRQYGEKSRFVGSAHNNLGLHLAAQGRIAEAEPHYRKGLELYLSHPILTPRAWTANAYVNLGSALRLLDRSREAIDYLEKGVALHEKDNRGALTMTLRDALDELGMAEKMLRRFADAERHARRAVEGMDALPPAEQRRIAAYLSNLGDLLRVAGRQTEAEAVLRRAIAVREATPNTTGDVGDAYALHNLAALYFERGDLAEAEPLFRRALAKLEKLLGPDHPRMVEPLNNLAQFLAAARRHDEAEPILRRALGLAERTAGPDHERTLLVVNNLGINHEMHGRYEDAIALFTRVIETMKRTLPADHPRIPEVMGSLATTYLRQGRLDAATAAFAEVRAMAARTHGAKDAFYGQILHNMAGVHLVAGRYAEAEALYIEALSIREPVLGPDHSEIIAGYGMLATAALGRESWPQAVTHSRRAAESLVRTFRQQRGKRATSVARSGVVNLITLVKALARSDGDPDAAANAFAAAQWLTMTDGAGSIARTAARTAKGDGALAKVVRERQDLAAEWSTKDTELTGLRGAAKPDTATIGALVSRLAAIDARLAAIDEELARDFPEYAALATPEPLAIEEVQAELAQDELLVVVLDTPAMETTPDESFVFAVPKSGEARFVRVPGGTEALKRDVQALRCGLDLAAWRGAGGKTCAGLTGGAPPKDAAALVFDPARAHALYRQIFGKIEDLMVGPGGAGLKLVVVPSGALAALPLNLLVTQPHGGAANEKPAFLVRRHALTTLPAVASLKALRRQTARAPAPEPFVGIGSPDLAGRDGTAAKAGDSCAEARLWAKLAGSGIASLTLGSQPRLEDIRQLEPVPETAPLLCDIAAKLGAGDDSVLIGAYAREAKVKELSASGALARRRVVHFATHGLVPGDIVGLGEPALVLTPPASSGDVVALERDNGLLTSSEVAELKLNADWVVLSACNTAAGAGAAERLKPARSFAAGNEVQARIFEITGIGDASGETAAPTDAGVTGLAPAFFYAGARALLVSHWSVDAGAAVKLATGAIDALKAEPRIGRAEALRRSMLALLDSADARERHPSYWAPFDLVGEGGAGR